MAKWYDKVWEFFEDEPIYADRPSTDSVVEGWKIAYNQQKDRAELAERKLALLRSLSDGMIKYGWGMQYGQDIRTILNMTEEEMNEDYGD